VVLRSQEFGQFFGEIGKMGVEGLEVGRYGSMKVGRFRKK
jgi:hypothetical protein